MRQQVLHDEKVERLEGLGKARGVGLAVEERGAHREERADRIGLARDHRVERGPEVARGFRREHLVDALGVNHVPLLAVGALARGDARTLEAAAGGHDDAAFAVDVAIEGVEDVDELIELDVVAVLGGIPAVVNDALEVGEVVGEPDEFVGRDARDLLGGLGGVAGGDFGEDVERGAHGGRRAVGKLHLLGEVQVGVRVGGFVEAHGGALFVEHDALEDDAVRLEVMHGVAVLAAAGLHVGFGERTAVGLDEVGGIRVLGEELQVGEAFLEHDVHHGEHEGGVGARTNRDPLGVSVGDVGHARVDAHHLGAAFTGLVERVQAAHGGAHGAADEDQVAQVLVVGLDLAGAREALAVHPVATGDRGGVAGARVADVVRGAERERDPLGVGGEGVRRGDDGLLAVLGDDVLELRGDVVEGFVPGDFLELAFTAFAHALERLPDAQRVVPDPHRGGGAAAVAALGVIRIREDANRLFRGRLADLLHGHEAAEGAAHAAGERMTAPALVLELLELCFDGPHGAGRGDGSRTAELDQPATRHSKVDNGVCHSLFSLVFCTNGSPERGGSRTETDSVRYAGREGAAFGTTPIGYLSILPYLVIPDMNSESA